MARLNRSEPALGPILCAAALAYGWWPPPASERPLWLLTWAALVAAAYAVLAVLRAARSRAVRDRAPAAAPSNDPDWRTAIAHDVRTPLMRMRLALAELAGQGADGEARAQTLESEVMRLEQLAGALVDLGAEDARGEDAVDVAAMGAEMAARAEPFFEAAGHRLTWATSPVTAVEGNRRHLERILDNLLQNALRHTEPGGDVSLRVGMDGPLWVRVEVENPSPPPTLPPSDLRRPFVQGRQDPGDGGFGLGLAVVDRLAARMEGRLLLHHREGRFRASVVLPRARRRPNTDVV